MSIVTLIFTAHICSLQEGNVHLGGPYDMEMFELVDLALFTYIYQGSRAWPIVG